MKLVNHEPTIKAFGNGFQITFPNKYTIFVKIGPGAKCTQTKTSTDPAEMLMSARFGGNYGPDCEVEIYAPNKTNITEKFGTVNSLEFVSTLELANLIYIVSSLK